MESGDPMRYVYYNVRSDLVPDEFRVSKELTELLTLKLSKYDFDKEHKLVETYTTLTRSKSHEPAVRFADNTSLRKSPVTSPIDIGKINDSYGFPPEQPPPPPPRSVAQSSRPGSGVNEFELRKSLVDRMMQETGQEQNICHFFLESTDWNYDTAVEMFSRMSGT